MPARASKAFEFAARWLAVGLPLGILLMSGSATQAQPTADQQATDLPTVDPPTTTHEGAPSVTWQRLDFRARKLFWTASTEVELSWPTASAVADELLITPERDGLRPRPPIALLTTRSAFGSRSDQVELWFEPATGRALQRRKVRHGSKAYLKTYRFTDDAVFSHRVSPRDTERQRPRGAWSQIDDTTIARTPDRCSPVIEPTALLYSVSKPDLEVGDHFELCSFSNKRTQRIVVRVEECVRLAVDYRRVAADGSTERRYGTVETLRIRVAPADPEAEGFEFLGLEGAMDLFVDLEHRVPVRLEGRLGALGRLRVELGSARLAPSHP